MRHNKLFLALVLLIFWTWSDAQVLKLEDILDSITISNPVVKMYNSEIRSMDEAAKGAKSWMPPEFSAGFWMVPYNTNLWKRGEDGVTGMGQFMIGGQQMLPNVKKLNADAAYMSSMSSVEIERKNATLNELRQDAKQLYYSWIILKKILHILDQNDKVLDFMIQNAEIRYQNGVDKISAYYKAKAASGNVKNMKLMYENDIREKRIRLNTLMGRNAFTEFDIDTTYQFQDYASVLFDSTFFYTQRSDFKAVDKEINLTLLKQEAEQYSLRPQFGVRYENMFGFGGFPMQFTFMGMMKLPLASWSSKMNKANVESLKWKAEALLSQKAMMANEYSGMAYGMLNELNLKKSQLMLYEENIIPALKNNYKTMQLAYEQNTEELFMLYDAWETLNMTQLEYIGLLDQALSLQVEIDRLMEK